MKKKLTAALAALAIAAAIAPAQAEAGEKTVSVQTSDLDLSSKAGRQVLDRRIARATEAVCGGYAGVHADDTPKIDRCRALPSVKSLLRSPRLKPRSRVAAR